MCKLHFRALFKIAHLSNVNRDIEATTNRAHIIGSRKFSRFLANANPFLQLAAYCDSPFLHRCFRFFSRAVPCMSRKLKSVTLYKNTSNFTLFCFERRSSRPSICNEESGTRETASDSRVLKIQRLNRKLTEMAASECVENGKRFV